MRSSYTKGWFAAPESKRSSGKRHGLLRPRKPRRPDRLSPSFIVRADDGGKLCRSGQLGLQREILHTRAHVRRLLGLNHNGVDAVHHFRRRARRREQGVPATAL